MKKIISFFLVFLVFASLALAVSVTTNKKDYTKGETVSITVSGCLATSILQISNANKPIPDMVAVEEGKGSWQATYNTNSDVSKGNYTLFVSCEDKTTATAYFCVDSVGCTTPITTTQQPATTVTVPSGGGGGRSSCLSNWSCSTWSYCDRNLKQTRSCTDKNWCQAAKTENRSCLACEESWLCSQWSACISGRQTRTCYEEHNCGTFLKKPAEQQSCAAAPSYVPTYTPPSYVPPQQQYAPQKQMPAPTFWDKYGSWLIAILAILLVTGGSLFYYLYFYKHKKGAAVNLNELKSWARKELQRGVNKEQLKGAIRGTSWTEQELNQVFGELSKEQIKVK